MPVLQVLLHHMYIVQHCFRNSSQDNMPWWSHCNILSWVLHSIARHSERQDSCFTAAHCSVNRSRTGAAVPVWLWAEASKAQMTSPNWHPLAVFWPCWEQANHCWHQEVINQGFLGYTRYWPHGVEIDGGWAAVGGGQLWRMRSSCICLCIAARPCRRQFIRNMKKGVRGIQPKYLVALKWIDLVHSMHFRVKCKSNI